MMENQPFWKAKTALVCFLLLFVGIIVGSIVEPGRYNKEIHIPMLIGGCLFVLVGFFWFSRLRYLLGGRQSTLARLLLDQPHEIAWVYEKSRQITIAYIIPIYAIKRITVVHQNLKQYTLAARSESLEALLGYIQANAPQARIG